MKNLIKKIKNSKSLNILFMITKTITTLLIILIVSIIFVQRISNNKVTIGGYGMFTVLTESMTPKYKVGDMLLAKKVDPDTIKVGDDIVYQGEVDSYANKIITHQVIKIEKKDGTKIYHTKGIANILEDPEITEKQIYGKIIYKSKILSLLSKIINNTYGFYFIVFIPFAIMVFMEFIDIIHDKEKIKR